MAQLSFLNICYIIGQHINSLSAMFDFDKLK